MEFKQYPSYKKSGVEWLGGVPEHWVGSKFKYIFQEKQHTKNMNLPFGAISFGSVVYKEDKANLTDELKENYQEVLQGEFLVNPLNLNYDLKSLRTALSKIDVVVSSGYFVLKLKNNTFNKRYLEYLLYIFDIRKMKTLGAGIRQTLTFRDMAVCDVAIPSACEQTQIASFLDYETFRIDNLIAKQEKLIELLEEQRKSIISHAVTKGLNPNAPMKDSGVEWLGDVPEHWRISSLKRYGYFKGGAGFPHAYQGNTEENIPFFKVNSLSKDKRFLSSFSDFVGEETAKKLGAKIFPKNSIFFAKVGAALLLERIRTNQQPCCIDNNMMGFVIQNELSFDFAFYLMSLIDFKYLVNPGAVPSINESQISSFLISVPPISEQTQIANYLDTETARIDNLIAKQKNLIEKLKEYRASIISHAVTGKIDVREFGA